jgi:phage FluMu protein Com
MLNKFPILIKYKVSTQKFLEQFCPSLKVLAEITFYFRSTTKAFYSTSKVFQRWTTTTTQARVRGCQTKPVKSYQNSLLEKKEWHTIKCF